MSLYVWLFIRDFSNVIVNIWWNIGNEFGFKQSWVNTSLCYCVKRLAGWTTFAFIFFKIKILRFWTRNAMISIKEWSIIWTCIFCFIDNWLSATIIIHLWPYIWIKNSNLLDTFLLCNTKFQIFITLLALFSIIVKIFFWQRALNTVFTCLIIKRRGIRAVFEEFTWFWSCANVIFSFLRIWIFYSFVCSKALPIFLIQFKRLITNTLSPIIVIMSWS